MMSGTIALEKIPDAIWLAKGWVFRRVLDELRRKLAGDPQAVEQLELADVFQSLSLYSLRETDPILTQLLCAKIKEVCDECLMAFHSVGGEIRPKCENVVPPADLTPPEFAQYFEGVQKLAAIVHSNKLPNDEG